MRLAQRALPPLLALGLAACGSPSQPSAGTGAPTTNAPAPPAGLGAGPRQQLTDGAYPLEGGGASTPLAGPAPSAAPAAGGASPPSPAASPAASASPSAGPDAPLIRGPVGERDLIPFTSTRMTGSGPGGFDVFLYDRRSGTVLTAQGVNTPHDEITPQLSHNRRYLVYATNALTGGFDVKRYDFETQQIEALDKLNTAANEFSPAISDDGQWLAYLSDEGGSQRARLFNLTTGAVLTPATAARLDENGWGGPNGAPSVSGDGRFVAFAANGPTGGLDVFVYAIGAGNLVKVAFVNSAADDYAPSLSADGNMLLYTTNRDGHADIYMTDLRNGLLNQLQLANTAASEDNAQFLGAGSNEVLFQSNRSGTSQLYVYDSPIGLLSALPVLHDTYSAPAPAPATNGGNGGSGLFWGSPGAGGGFGGGVFGGANNRGRGLGF